MISFFVARSSADRGSSISSSFGCERSARPIATRWRSPPERLRGDRSSSGATPRSSTTSSKPIGRRPSAHRQGGETPPRQGLRRAEHQIAAHRQVREQARFLEDITERPLVGRQKRSVPALPRLAVDLADAVAHAQEPGDAAQHRRLAAARRTEERGHALRRRGEAGVEGELADRPPEFRADLASALIRGPARSAFRSGSSRGSRRRRTRPCRRRGCWPRPIASSRHSRRWRST